MIAGTRVLVCGEISIDCCPDRVAELKLRYPGRVEDVESIMIDDRDYCCGMDPCLRNERGTNG